MLWVGARHPGQFDIAVCEDQVRRLLAQRHRLSIGQSHQGNGIRRGKTEARVDRGHGGNIPPDHTKVVNC
jgi:hypothetical protein